MCTTYDYIIVIRKKNVETFRVFNKPNFFIEVLKNN